MFSFLANATLVTITNNIGLIARMCALNEKIDKVSLNWFKWRSINKSFLNEFCRSFLLETFYASIQFRWNFWHLPWIIGRKILWKHFSLSMKVILAPLGHYCCLKFIFFSKFFLIIPGCFGRFMLHTYTHTHTLALSHWLFFPAK